jgi:Secretion system C-terminal sorting domain
MVSLKVFDLLGREVVTLVNEVKSAGTHTATFSANNIPSGVYFYRLQSGSFSETKRLVLLK